MAKRTRDEFDLTTVAGMPNSRGREIRIGEGELGVTSDRDKLAWLNHFEERRQ
jgi:hypothetical protein